MLDKLEALKIRYKDLEMQLSDPEVVNDLSKFKRIGKEYRDLEPVVVAYEKYKTLLSNLKYNKELQKSESDADMLEMIKEELHDLEEELEPLEFEIRQLLIPKDPGDDKNAIIEIRAGTGGDEASLFAGDLFKMYKRYCENKGWQIEVISENQGTSGGYKEIVMNVIGDGAYGIL